MRSETRDTQSRSRRSCAAAMLLLASGLITAPTTHAQSIPAQSGSQPADSPPAASQPDITTEAQAIENEVIGNVLRQTFGAHTVDDLALPGDFISKVADRAFRTAYERQYRSIIADPPSSSAGAAGSPAATESASEGSSLSTTLVIFIAAVIAIAVVFGFVRAMKKESAA